MAGYKTNIKSKPHNVKRTWNDVEIKPTLHISEEGKKMMAGSIDGEICRDELGKVIPLNSIKHNGIL